MSLQDQVTQQDAQDATTKNYVDTNISALASNPLGEYFPSRFNLIYHKPRNVV